MQNNGVAICSPLYCPWSEKKIEPLDLIIYIYCGQSPEKWLDSRDRSLFMWHRDGRGGGCEHFSNSKKGTWSPLFVKMHRKSYIDLAPPPIKQQGYSSPPHFHPPPCHVNNEHSPSKIKKNMMSWWHEAAFGSLFLTWRLTHKLREITFLTGGGTSKIGPNLPALFCDPPYRTSM